MAQAQPKADKIDISEANPSNVASLSTIVARSFHPVNAYIKKVLPDTPAMRQWWSEMFSDFIADPDCRLLTAVDSETGEAVGVMPLRLCAPEDKGAGLWTRHELTSDHDEEGYLAMVGSMAENRVRLMTEHHFLVELFGVDHRYQGRQIGTRILAQACRTADEAGHQMFVTANMNASPFYLKQGFEVKGKEVMPGDGEYVEYMLVRPPRRQV